jgi:hypothetical protein
MGLPELDKVLGRGGVAVGIVRVHLEERDELLERAGDLLRLLLARGRVARRLQVGVQEFVHSQQLLQVGEDVAVQLGRHDRL